MARCSSASATPGPGPRTLCRDADRAGYQPREHERGRQPRLPVAVPRRTHRPAPHPGTFVQQFRAPGVAATQTRTAAFRQLVLQPPPRSSRVPSATASEPPPATSSASAEPGTATGHPRRELSAAQRWPGNTLVPIPYPAHLERQTARTLRTSQLTRSRDRAAASRPLARPFQLCRHDRHRGDWRRRGLRLAVGLILGHNLASTLGHATDGSASAC
jgi:hypothetical protein